MRFLKLMLVAVMATGFGAAQAAIVEGQDYEVIPTVKPQANPNKIEVLEFFGYFCIHCKNLDPILRKHTPTFASDTYVRSAHVVWEPDMMTFARITSAVNSTGMKNQANPAIFSAMFDQKINLSDEKTFKEWALKQPSFDGKKLVAAYDSFSSQTDAKNMEKLTKEYQIEGTPTIIVGGKYKVIIRDFNQSMSVTDELVEKVRQERNMTKPVAKAQKAYSSKGFAAAVSANK